MTKHLPTVVKHKWLLLLYHYSFNLKLLFLSQQDLLRYPIIQSSPFPESNQFRAKLCFLKPSPQITHQTLQCILFNTLLLKWSTVVPGVCSPFLQWIINHYSVFLVILGWRACVLGSLVLPPKIIIFSRKEPLSYSFWYLPLYKNSAFNKVNKSKTFIEWTHE